MASTNLNTWTDAPLPKLAVVAAGEDVLDRMERAVSRVRERLLRAAAALDRAGVSYAVIGGNAVAHWVATVDEGAVRNTRDIDLLVRREDLPAVTTALEGAGFVRDELVDVVMFRDGHQGKPSEAIHLLFAGEKARPDHPMTIPELRTTSGPAAFRVIDLESLVLLKLMSNRDKDRTHLRDLIAVGLVDATWPARFPAELSAKLQGILDTPEG